MIINQLGKQSSPDLGTTWIFFSSTRFLSLSRVGKSQKNQSMLTFRSQHEHVTCWSDELSVSRFVWNSLQIIKKITVTENVVFFLVFVFFLTNSCWNLLKRLKRFTCRQKKREKKEKCLKKIDGDFFWSQISRKPLGPFI